MAKTFQLHHMRNFNRIDVKENHSSRNRLFNFSPSNLLIFNSLFKNVSSMSADIDTFYNAVLNYVLKTGEIIRDRITQKKTVTYKSCSIDFVTETDKEVENFLIKSLSHDFPNHQFIGEESVSEDPLKLSDDPTWIIDPIDGTTNFVHSFPHSCISIALFVNQIPEIGIVYNPIIEQLFTACRGKGAFLNGKPIHVSNTTELNQALIMMEFGTSRDAKKLEVVGNNQRMLMRQVHGLRALGSAALDMAMVAMGSADAYFEFGIHVWDIAAGELLVTEAGGVIIDPAGGPVDRFSRRVLVASSQSLAEQLAVKLVQYYPQPRD